MSSSPPRKKERKSAGSEFESQPELVAFEKLRLVLGRHYFDVCERLALDYVPRCVRNVTECAQHHTSKRGPRTKCISVMRSMNTQEQIAEQRPDQFVEFLGQAIMRREFIEAELFVAGLQLMLTINRPTAELRAGYEVTDIVYGTGELLEKCLAQFPPCRWDLRSAYQHIVFGKLDAPCFGKYDQNEGVFRNVLYLIEHYIETEPVKPSSEQTGKSGQKNQARRMAPKDDEMFFSNYSSWMSSNRQCYDFDQLSRDERFQRLFLVLQILVKVLEMDFAMWILRNPTKTRQNLCNPSRCPLVVRIAWDGDYGSVNLFVRKLFQTFVHMNALKYPPDDIAVFSRLLNLITVAVNLSEFQHSDGLIQYPCVKDNSQYYARQLWKTLETSAYFSVDLCLRMIRMLRSPFLRLRLSELVIQKFNRHSHPCNVRGFFKQLLDRCWLDYSDGKPPEEGGTSTSTVRYPVLTKQHPRVKSIEMYQHQYVELLCIGFRAYCQMYQIPAYFRASMVQTTPDIPVTNDVSADDPMNECAPGERVVSEPVLDERMTFQGIAVNGEHLLEYREDIKYLLLIKQLLQKLDTPEEAALLREWIAFLAEVDPSLAITMTL